MRAPENQSVDAALLEPFKIYLGRHFDHLIIRPAFLNERNKKRASAAVNLHGGIGRFQIPHPRGSVLTSSYHPAVVRAEGHGVNRILMTFEHEGLGDGIGRHPVQLYESAAMALFLLAYLVGLAARASWATRRGFYVMCMA